MGSSFKESERDALGRMAAKYGIDNADKFFSHDPYYQGSVQHINYNIKKDKEFVDNAVSSINKGLSNLRVKPSADEKDLLGYLIASDVVGDERGCGEDGKESGKRRQTTSVCTGLAKGVHFGNTLHRTVAGDKYAEHEAAAQRHQNYATAGNIVGRRRDYGRRGRFGVKWRGTCSENGNDGGYRRRSFSGDVRAEEIHKANEGGQTYGEAFKQAGVQAAGNALPVGVMGKASGALKSALRKPLNAVAEGTGNTVAGIGERGILDGDVGTAGEIAADFGFGAGLSAGMDYIPDIPKLFNWAIYLNRTFSVIYFSKTTPLSM